MVIHVLVELFTSCRVLVLQACFHQIDGVHDGYTHNASNSSI